MKRKISVIGLGYVGLPLAVALAKKFDWVMGFDINMKKVEELLSGNDRTGEVTREDLMATSLRMTSQPEDIAQTDFYIVAVPTPVDRAHRPDLGPVLSASEIVGRVIKPGSIVVYESTVYPGVTEEICRSVLAEVSGLEPGKDFKLGYSPERINPGDKVHTVENIIKVVSAEDEETLDIVAQVYSAIISAGVHRAPNIKVAEAAKVIENTQRDLNIAFMNELAIICDRLKIRTADVLKAARTKWNFLPFTPGLVGGHCIGVDPYYLTTKAEELGYHPQVILAGRRINDGMGKYIAEQTVKWLVRSGCNVYKAKIGILGLTFKENVPDLRNSRVPDIINELREYHADVLVHDPIGNPGEALEEYGLELCSEQDLHDLDAVVLAVSHQDYLEKGSRFIEQMLKNGRGVIIDVKSVFEPCEFSPGIQYWSL